MKIDYKQERESRDLTLQQVATLSGYSIGTINGLENHGEGSERLKTKLNEIFELGFRSVQRQSQSQSQNQSPILREDPQPPVTRADILEAKRQILEILDHLLKKFA